MGTVASFHLTRERPLGAVTAMAQMVGQGRLARRVPGLRFARRLGTGRGRAMGLQGDLRRWALFAVWDDEAALDAFLADDPVASRWRDRSLELWSVRLAPLAVHGTWGGADPFTGLDDDAAHRAAATHDGPVAVLTRARIPARHWRAFYAAVPPVEAHLHGAPGLLEATGVGERPVGLLATFSLWRSAEDMEAFAYRGSVHEEVVRATRAGGWFAEELFARFRPYGSTGTWDGRDPLAAGDGNGS
ncbi:MAG: hypothetical protein WD232_00860 [Acidimicrobiales bacterium]